MNADPVAGGSGTGGGANAAPAAGQAGAGDGENASSSSTSSDEYDDVPAEAAAAAPPAVLRLGGDDDDEDIVWESTTPELSLEKSVREAFFLLSLITNTDVTEEEAGRARAALERRITGQIFGAALSDFGEKALTKKVSKEVRNQHKDHNVLQACKLGKRDVVTARMKRDFVVASDSCVFPASTPEKGQTALRRILKAANLIVRNNKLSGKAAFSLTQGSFKGDALELHTHYEASDRWTVFFRLIQQLSLASAPQSSLLRELHSLLHSRPTPGQLGPTVTRLIGLHKKLSENLPMKEREAAYTTNCRASLNQLAVLWYPSNVSDVDTWYKKLTTQFEEEHAQLVRENKTSDARKLEREFCPVQAYSEAIMTVLCNIEPQQTPNQIFVDNQDMKKVKVHAAEMTPQTQVGPDEFNPSLQPLLAARQGGVSPSDVAMQQKFLAGREFASSIPQQQPGSHSIMFYGPPTPTPVAGYGPPPLAAFPAQQQTNAQQFPSSNGRNRRSRRGNPPPPGQPPFQGYPVQNASGAYPAGIAPPQMPARQQQWQTTPNAHAIPVVPQPGVQQTAGPPLAPPVAGAFQGQGGDGQKRGKSMLGRLRPSHIPPENLCLKCLRHTRVNDKGGLAECYRFPMLSAAQMRNPCAICTGLHPTNICNQHIPLNELRKNTPRPDRAQPPAPGFYSNQCPQQQQVYQGVVHATQQGHPQAGHVARQQEDFPPLPPPSGQY